MRVYFFFSLCIFLLSIQKFECISYLLETALFQTFSVISLKTFFDVKRKFQGTTF